VGKLIYLMNVSLDGFIETPDHGLDWSTVDDELHSWFSEHEDRAEAMLYGRRLWETMTYWLTAESDPNANDVMREYARVWNAKPKIVFSTSLEPPGGNARVVSGDVAEILGDLRREFSGDLHVGGPTLAAQFIERGLVDEFGLVVHPVVLGAGTPFFPTLRERIGLRLAETRTFGVGATYLRYVRD
jgi:dihydrofolate reductase